MVVKGGGSRQVCDSHKPEKSPSPPKSELCPGEGVDVEGKRVTEGSDPRMIAPRGYDVNTQFGFCGLFVKDKVRAAMYKPQLQVFAHHPSTGP